jgi:hypothetical protein
VRSRDKPQMRRHQQQTNIQMVDNSFLREPIMTARGEKRNVDAIYTEMKTSKPGPNFSYNGLSEQAKSLSQIYGIEDFPEIPYNKPTSRADALQTLEWMHHALGKVHRPSAPPPDREKPEDDDSDLIIAFQKENEILEVALAEALKQIAVQCHERASLLSTIFNLMQEHSKWYSSRYSQLIKLQSFVNAQSASIEAQARSYAAVKINQYQREMEEKLDDGLKVLSKRLTETIAERDEYRDRYEVAESMFLHEKDKATKLQEKMTEKEFTLRQMQRTHSQQKPASSLLAPGLSRSRSNSAVNSRQGSRQGSRLASRSNSHQGSRLASAAVSRPGSPTQASPSTQELLMATSTALFGPQTDPEHGGDPDKAVGKVAWTMKLGDSSDESSSDDDDSMDESSSGSSDPMEQLPLVYKHNGVLVSAEYDQDGEIVGLTAVDTEDKAVNTVGGGSFMGVVSTLIQKSRADNPKQETPSDSSEVYEAFAQTDIVQTMMEQVFNEENEIRTGTLPRKMSQADRQATQKMIKAFSKRTLSRRRSSTKMFALQALHRKGTFTERLSQVVNLVVETDSLDPEVFDLKSKKLTRKLAVSVLMDDACSRGDMKLAIENFFIGTYGMSGLADRHAGNFLCSVKVYNRDPFLQSFLRVLQQGEPFLVSRVSKLMEDIQMSQQKGAKTANVTTAADSMAEWLISAARAAQTLQQQFVPSYWSKIQVKVLNALDGLKNSDNFVDTGFILQTAVAEFLLEKKNEELLYQETFFKVCGSSKGRMTLDKFQEAMQLLHVKKGADTLAYRYHMAVSRGDNVGDGNIGIQKFVVLASSFNVDLNVDDEDPESIGQTKHHAVSKLVKMKEGLKLEVLQAVISEEEHVAEKEERKTASDKFRSTVSKMKMGLRAAARFAEQGDTDSAVETFQHALKVITKQKKKELSAINDELNADNDDEELISGLSPGEAIGDD